MDIAGILFGSNANPWADILGERARIAAGGVGAVKPNATIVNEHIASASRLDKTSKKTLTNLTSLAEQFSPGNTALMRNIMGIAGIMQMGAKEQTYSAGTMPYAKILESRYLPRLKVDA